jgi:hypothetical protein
MRFQLTDPLGDTSARADISSRNPRQFGSAEESQALNLCFPWLLNIDQSRTDLAPGSCQTRLSVRVFGFHFTWTPARRMQLRATPALGAPPGPVAAPERRRGRRPRTDGPELDP